MKKSMLVLMIAACISTARAGDPGGIQLSTQLGWDNLQIDDDRLAGNDRFRHDGVTVGAAVAYRLPGGLLFEGAMLHSAYTDFVPIIFGLTDYSFDSHQYSAAAGWQFDADRWRFTPKVGVARSRLTSSSRVILTPNGDRTDSFYATVPFGEASVVRRMGSHFAMGAFLRETFEEFGHSRSWGLTLQVHFD